MANANKDPRSMTPPKQAALAEIAKRHLGFETLDTRNSDRADFRNVAVWNVLAALRAAFEAGNVAAIERLSGKSQTYPVKRSDGSAVQVTVPPRECRRCDGSGREPLPRPMNPSKTCTACNGTGYEMEV